MLEFDRSTVIVAAHPDDETIGIGGHLGRFADAVLVHVTDGAPRDLVDARAAGFATREAYAQARRRELEAALAIAGFDRTRTRSVGLVDQEASLNLVELTHTLVGLFKDIRPLVILAPAYEGGHPDHDAAAFAVHAARRLEEREGLAPPAVIEYALYHDKFGAMSTCEFLTCVDCEQELVALASQALQDKRRMIECFATQRKTLRAFRIELERFRRAPRYDFTQPPHPGTLYYERFSWGVTGPHWRALAHRALETLAIGSGA